MSTTSGITSALAVPEPRPEAAFLLGGHSRLIGDLLDAWADWGRDLFGFQLDLVKALNEMDQAVLVLRGDLEEKSYRDLQKAISAVKECVQEIFDYHGGIEKWVILCSEADHALHSFHPYYRWFDFGRTIAGYKIKAMKVEKGGELPRFDNLLRKAQQLTDEYPAKVPELESLLLLAPELPTKPEWVLLKVLGKEDDSSNPHESNGAAVGIQLYYLYVAILNQLAKLTRTPESASEIPRWDDTRCTLSWRGTVIRQFRAAPTNQKKIVESFHRRQWERSILDPFNDSDKLHKTITDLNETLEPGTIRFGGDGTGKGVRWYPVHNPST